jgi:uncharacterized protein (DUF1330 family)
MPAFSTAQLDQFVSADPDNPVVMLNLIRFAPDGAETYRRYIERFQTSGVDRRYGVTIVYAGAGHSALVADAGGDWDLVALFRYPSRQHFVDMINDPDYQAFEHLRAEAVTTAVLQPTTPTL